MQLNEPTVAGVKFLEYSGIAGHWWAPQDTRGQFWVAVCTRNHWAVGTNRYSVQWEANSSRHHQAAGLWEIGIPSGQQVGNTRKQVPKGIGTT